jgi:hypothetical protein
MILGMGALFRVHATPQLTMKMCLMVDCKIAGLGSSGFTRQKLQKFCVLVGYNERMNDGEEWVGRLGNEHEKPIVYHYDCKTMMRRILPITMLHD